MPFTAWLVSSLSRIFPWTPSPRDLASPPLEIARNERFAFQAAFRLTEEQPAKVQASISGPQGWQFRVRRVGYVPVMHYNSDVPPEHQEGALPGFVPDPLFDETEFELARRETHAFWFSVVPDPETPPGKHSLTVTLECQGKAHHLTATVTVRDVLIERRRDFRVTNWFYNDALLDFHDCSAWDERYWMVLENYFTNLAAHGQDTIYTPVFTPPLDGVKRPSQLLHVTERAEGEYEFDWTQVERYVKLARKCGLDHFEWSHLFTQWGVAHALRIYHGHGTDERLLWDPETPATGEVYRSFLSQFLPQLKQFVKRHKLMDCSFFHLSDEPHEQHVPAYKAARELLRELAPWMQVMDALSHVEFARDGLTDIPVPVTNAALDFVAEDIPSWVYYCCVPRGRYIQRLLDTPLSQIRMNGWTFYRWPFQGFLHWGLNYWYQSGSRTKIDPFMTQDGKRWPTWAFGDPFMIYPGADGPIDSIRWEVFGHSLQDYAMLQSQGIARESKLLEPIHAFDDFPRDEAWLNATRHIIFGGEKG